MFVRFLYSRSKARDVRFFTIMAFNAYVQHIGVKHADLIQSELRNMIGVST